MRKIFLFLAAISFFFIIPQKADAFCLTFNGKFTATNWPDASKKIEVWCKGDEPLGPSQCSGSNQSVGPNESFSLDRCSCLVDPEGKCLQVKNLPPGCTVNKNPIACGTNGPNAVVANFEVSCPASPTPKPTTCVESDYCEHWHTKDNIPADNPHKQKILECLDKGYYVHTKKLCNNAGYEVTCDTSVAKCKIPDKPTNTPTATKTPTATPPVDGPTATPTNTPPADGPTATPPTDGPTATPPGSGPTATPPADVPTSTPRPPTATPTPDFNEAMCKCDSMSVSQIIAGQPAVFTATSKVTGSDVTKAEAKQIEFVLTAGNDPRNRKVIAGPQRVNTTSSGGTSEVTYQAQWTVNIPAAVEKNTDYLARATIKCTRKTTAHAYPYTALVLAESDNKGLFSFIADFFRNLFGRNTSNQAGNASATPTASPVEVQDDFVSIAEKNNLQLGSFAPAKVVENKCPTVKFRFQ